MATTTNSTAESAVRSSSSNSPQPAPGRKKSGLFVKILLGLAAVMVGLAVVVNAQPNEFTIKRSAVIAAPPADVFAHVNDFHNWQAWSPWEKLDPALQRNYAGPEKGEGAVYTWAGNSEVGEGRMTIVESRPNEQIRLKLEFLKPFAATHEGGFTFEPQGDKTAVTWSMSGKNTFLCKAIHMCMDMDKMVGGQFEEGLAGLDKAARSGASAPAGSSEAQ